MDKKRATPPPLPVETQDLPSPRADEEGRARQLMQDAKEMNRVEREVRAMEEYGWIIVESLTIQRQAAILARCEATGRPVAEVAPQAAPGLLQSVRNEPPPKKRGCLGLFLLAGVTAAAVIGLR